MVKVVAKPRRQAKAARPKLNRAQKFVLDHRALRALAPATARDNEEWFVIAREFEQHVSRERSPITGVHYRRAFARLFKVDQRTFAAMASDEYVKFVRCKKDSSSLNSASMRAFGAFWGKRVAEAPARPVASAARNSDVSGQDRERMPGVMRSFERHLDKVFKKATSSQYRRAFSHLLKEDASSLHTMASESFEHSLKRQRKSHILRASVKAFKAFFAKRGGAAKKSAVMTERRVDGDSESGQRELTQTEGAKDAGSAKTDGEKDSGLQPFLDHLRNEKERVTAVQYGAAIRKLAKVHRKSLDAMASEEYLNMVRKLSWSYKYSAAVRALCKFRSGLAMGSGEQRAQANGEARRRLAAAQTSSRPVSDGDVLSVLRLWPFEKNPNRLNVMPEGTEWVHSATVGIIGDRRGRTVLSIATAGAEDIVRLLCRWLEHQIGVGFGATAFPLTSININKGYAAARHRDKSNEGPSAIRALGNYRDGLLRYWPQAAADADLGGLQDGDSVLLDPRNEMVVFDGNRPHAVTPFDGERYSVVFFTSSRHKRAAPETRAEARRLGMQWPTAHLLVAARARL